MAQYHLPPSEPIAGTPQASFSQVGDSHLPLPSWGSGVPGTTPTPLLPHPNLVPPPARQAGVYSHATVATCSESIRVTDSVKAVPENLTVGTGVKLTRTVSSPRQAASGAKQDSKSELTCSVCLEQFKDPKVLPCCHTFCKQCLQSLVKRRNSANSQPANATGGRRQFTRRPASSSRGSSTLSCPQCRAEHRMPESGVNGFLTDFSLIHDLEVAAVVKEKEEKPSCGQCENSNPSVAYCVQCEAFLCKFCSSAHKQMKSFKEHNVLPLSKVNSDTLKPSVKSVKCFKHQGEDIKLYCKTCKQLICRDCTLVEHRSHDFHFANEARQGFKAELVKLVDKSKEKLVVYEKELQEVQKAEKFLQSEPDTVKKQIATAFDTYMHALQSRRQTLMAEVDSRYQADSKKVWAHKEFTETAIADITASLQFAERACKCSSDAEMISLTKQAMQRLESLNKKEHKLKDTYQVVDKTASYTCSHIEKQLLTCDSVTARSPSLQLSAVHRNPAIGEKIEFTVNCNCISYPKLNSNVTPTIIIKYGHCKKPFNEFVVTKKGRSSWTVTMECICGGDHTVSASLLGYSANPKTITVSGVPHNGARVRPGPDWSQGTKDEGQKGTVTQSHQSQQAWDYSSHSHHVIYVRWDNGSNGGPYRWGASRRDSTQQYQVEIVPSQRAH